MKKLWMSLIILFLSYGIALGYTESHYVTPNGAGSFNGTSWGNAFSMAQLNTTSIWDTDDSADGKIGPNDIVYFQGTTFGPGYNFNAPGTVSGSTSKPITFDGYEAGNCEAPMNLGGNGVYDECTSSALFDFNSGSDGDPSYPAMRFSGDHYWFVIQDFRFKDVDNGIWFTDDGNHNSPQYMCVYRNYFNETYGKALRWTVNVAYNYPYNLKHYTIGGSAANGNYFYNCGWENDWPDHDTASVGLSYGTDFIYSYNEIKSDKTSTDHDFLPANLMEINGLGSIEKSNILVEENIFDGSAFQSGLAIKEEGGYGVIVRKNLFRNHRRIGNASAWAFDFNGRSNEQCGSCPDLKWHDSYAYLNYIESGNGIGTSAYKGAYNIWWFSNIIVTKQTGILVGNDSKGASWGIRAYNNTIYHTGNGSANSSDNRTAFRITSFLTTVPSFIKNNILLENRFNQDPNRHQIITNDNPANVDLDYNLYWQSLDTDAGYIAGYGMLTVGGMRSSLGWETHGNFANPNLANPSSGLFYPLGGSPAIDKGQDLRSTDIETISIVDGSGNTNNITVRGDEAFGVGTDFSTRPFTIVSINRDACTTCGSGWDIGAFEIGESGAPFSITSYGPTVPQPAGNVTMFINTSSASDCKFIHEDDGDCSSDYDLEFTDFTTGQGTTIHSELFEDLEGGVAELYHGKCKNPSGIFSTCVEILIDIYTGEEGEGESIIPGPINFRMKVGGVNIDVNPSSSIGIR